MYSAVEEQLERSQGEAFSVHEDSGNEEHESIRCRVEVLCVEGSETWNSLSAR